MLENYFPILVFVAVGLAVGIGARLANFVVAPLSLLSGTFYSIDSLSGDERQEAITRGSQIFLTNCTAAWPSMSG